MGSHGILAIANDDSEAVRQRAPRTRVLLSCLLVTTSDEYRVKLRNVSASGAMMEGGKLPPEGTDVILRRGLVDTFATVAWSGGGRGGLRFDEPIGDVSGWAHMPVPARPMAAPARSGRPDLRPVPLTPDEQALAREWSTASGRAAGD